MFIKPISKLIKNYPISEHFIIFNINHLIDNPNVKSCGTEDIKAVREAIQTNSNVETSSAITSCRVLEIATEADFEFYQANNSNIVAANNNILGILNQVEGVYQLTFNIKFFVTFQSIWSVSNDPYNAVGSGNVVDELASWWQTNRNNVNRDIVYFFSGKSGHRVKGAAKVLGAICNNIANSYAFTATAVTNELIITTAHEIGHLFNAVHPNSINAASCSPNRTIMCTDASNLGRILQFSEFSQGEINTWINGNSACLTNVSNVKIGGTDPICSSGQFTVNGLPPNSSITSWSSSNTSALTVTNSGVPTRQNNFVGSVNVTANGNFGNDGCTFNVTKQVWVGKPYAFMVQGPSPVNSGSFVYYSVTPWGSQPSFAQQGVNPLNTSWSFTHPPSSAGWSCFGCTGSSIGVQVGSMSTQLSAQLSNACGSTISNIQIHVSQVGCPPGGCIEPFFVYPNPVEDILSIDLDDNSNLFENQLSGSLLSTKSPSTMPTARWCTIAVSATPKQV